MKHENLNNNTQSTKIDMEVISNSTDFWKEAQEFLKSQLPSDFEDKLKQYVLDKGYNKNEFRLFKNMLQESVGLHGTIILLKHYS